MHSKYFLLILLLSIYLRSFSCALNCSEEAFDCGVVGYIAYPFWGGDRTSECGREGFEIVCLQGKIPILKISSLSYIIQELDFSTNTMIVVRQDFQDTYCPQHLHNTTIDWEHFKYPPNSTDRNLTLYYDCAADHVQPNAFLCANQTSSNLFKIGDGDASSSSGNTSCNTNIYVPVNREDAESLQNPTASSINSLRSALITGFSIQWLNDSRQGVAPFCNSKVYRSCTVTAAALQPDRPICNTTRSYAECLPKENQGKGRNRTVYEGDSPAPSIKVPAPSPSPDHSEDGAAVPSITPSMPPLLAPAYAPPPPNGMSTTNYPLPRHKHNTTQLNHGKNLAKKIALVVPLTVAGMIIASISIHCFLKRRRLVTGMWKHDVEKLLLQQGSLTPKRYRYSEIKKITKSFSDKLGQGGYGSVYKGMLPNACHVAVKVLMETADSNGEEFINEVASISRTSHVNIVTLLGFCYEGNRRALVYEFMPNSSLDKFLNHNQSAVANMDLEKLYKIAVGIAKGLEYLHTGCTTRIVHFDIKPQNILLDEDFCPKISDFGLAKLYKKKQSILSVLGTRGTAGYIAPEVFSRNFGGVSHKSDVYSYGMMLLEMAGARKATPAEAIQSSENYFPDKIYEEVIVDDLMMMDGEGETRKKMFVVGFWCIQTIPSSRPSISEVVEMLEGEISSIQIPPKPFLFSPNLPSHEMVSSSLSAYVDTQNSAEY